MGARRLSGWFLVAIFFVLVAVGCSSNDDLSESAVDDSPVVDLTESQEPQLDLAERFTQADQTWLAIWAAVVSSDADTSWPQVADNLAAEEIDLLQLLNQEPATSSFEFKNAVIGHNPIRTVVDESTVRIEDCFTRVFDDGRQYGGIHYIGDASWIDDTWVFTITHPTKIADAGCVPETVAHSAIDFYNSLLEAEAEWWLEPDPDNPKLDQFLTDTELDYVRGRLADLVGEGNYIVTASDSVRRNPEVTFFGPDYLTIRDCYDSTSEYGEFSLTTGERFGTPAIDQIVTEVDLIQEDGQWKVTAGRESVSIMCVKAPTSEGLTEVG